MERAGTVGRRLQHRSFFPGVRGSRNVEKVSAGLFHSLAIKNDGLYAWGWNALGQLGDGTIVDRRAPTKVAGGNFVAVAAGTFHSLATARP